VQLGHEQSAEAGSMLLQKLIKAKNAADRAFDSWRGCHSV